MFWIDKLFNNMAKGQEVDHLEDERCFFNIDPFNNTFPPLPVPCEPPIDTFTHITVTINCGCSTFQFPLDRKQIIYTEGYAQCMLDSDFLNQFCQVFCFMRGLQDSGDKEAVDVYSQILSNMLNAQNKKCGQGHWIQFYQPGDPNRIVKVDDTGAGDVG